MSKSKDYFEIEFGSRGDNGSAFIKNFSKMFKRIPNSKIINTEGKGIKQIIEELDTDTSKEDSPD